MSVKILNIIASDAVMNEITSLRAIPDVRVSDPIPTKSLSEGLRAPISPDQFVEIFQYATTILQTGTAGVLFFSALVKLLKQFEGAKVEVRDPKTQAKLFDVDEHTAVSSLEKYLN